LKAQTRKITFLLAGAGVSLAIMALLALHPGGKSIETTANGAAIRLSVDRRWVVYDNDCTIARWKIEGAAAVSFGHQVQTPTGSTKVCIHDQPEKFTWRIQFPDETEQTYVLEVGFIGYQPEIWILALVTQVLLVAVAYFALAWLIEWRFAGLVPRLRSLLRTAQVLALSLIVALLLLECGMRFYFTNYGTENQRERYIYSDEVLHQRASRAALPFLNIGLSEAGGNPLGYRGPAVAIPKPDGVYRIVVLGDSTVYGLGLRAEQAFPAQMERIFHEEYGYTQVEVVNAGQSAYSTWHSLVNLAFRVLELEPDLILIYQTIPDVGVRELAPDCYRGINAHRGLNPIPSILQMNNQVSIPSALARFVGINLGWLDVPDPDNNFAQVIECVNDPRPPREEALAANPPVYFERNLRTMINVARGHNIEVMLSTWAYDETLPPDDQPYWWVAAEEHNAITRQLADELETYFFDLAATELPHDPALWGGDHIHSSVTGYNEQARYYVDYLLQSGLVSTP
jgi:lysophospholipase L1-like esterase